MLNDRRDSQQKDIKLAVVIVNYRTPKLVIDCIESFYAQLSDDSAVVIVDNASGDGSVEHLRTWAIQHDRKGVVRLIESPLNRGFAAGNNLEFAVSRRRTICWSTAIRFFVPMPFNVC